MTTIHIHKILTYSYAHIKSMSINVVYVHTWCILYASSMNAPYMYTEFTIGRQVYNNIKKKNQIITFAIAAQ